MSVFNLINRVATREELIELLRKTEEQRAELERKMGVTDEMVNRFLCWRLPASFNPDGGVSFDKKNRDPNTHMWPVGTNLFSADQARQMLAHVLSA